MCYVKFNSGEQMREVLLVSKNMVYS